MMKKPLKPGEKRERKDNKMMIKIFIGMILLISALIIYEANAGGCCDTIVSVTEVTEVTEVYSTTITQGISDKDLATGIATALAAGGHQFDYSTTDWQGSLVGSYETGEDQNAVSFGLGKRFNEMDALLHTSYTQSDSEHYVTFGGTFRF